MCFPFDAVILDVKKGFGSGKRRGIVVVWGLARGDA